MVLCSGFLYASSWQVITESVGLPSSQVTSMAVFKNYMAVGTDRGLAVYSGLTCEWTIPRLPDELASTAVRDLAYDENGNLWFATANGVGSLQKDGCEVFGTADGLITLDCEKLQIKEKQVFVGSFGGFVSKAFIPVNGRTSFVPVNFRRSGAEEGLHLRSVGISGLAMLDSSVGWFSTKGAGLIHCEGMTQTTFDRSSGLSTDWVEAFWRFKGPGKLWHMLVATLKGVTMFRNEKSLGQIEIPFLSENTWITSVITVFSESFPKPERVGANQEWSLATFLGQRCMWIGTKNDGLMRFEKGQWAQFTPDNSVLPSKTINRIYFHGGRIMVCSAGGLVIIPLAANSFDEFKFIGLGNKNCKTIYPHSSQAEVQILEKDEDFWVVTDQGLCRFVGASGINDQLLKDNPDLSASMEGKPADDETSSGGRPTTKLGDLKWDRLNLENGRLFDDRIRAFVGDSFGAQWVIFRNDVLARLRIEKLPKKEDERDERKEQYVWEFLEGNNIPWVSGNELTCLWFSQGKLFVGTKDDGFYVLNNPATRKDQLGIIEFSWKHFSQSDGLVYPRVYGFCNWKSGQNQVYTVLRHDEGITLWSDGDFNYISLGSGRKLTCMASDFLGNLWIGTDGSGLLRICPDFSIKEYTSANVQLDSNRITALAAGNENQEGKMNLWVACDNVRAGSDVIPNSVNKRLMEVDVDGSSVFFFDGLIWDRWKYPGVKCFLLDGDYLFAGTNIRLRRFFVPVYKNQ